MTDCVYFQNLIKELNIADSNTGDCCGWSMVECDNNKSITKLDFSGYQGINNKVAFPQTVQYFTNLKEFSIAGQKNINEIYSLPTGKLEKVDLSNSGISSSIFPTWILDAENLKELDISNTQITGIPQRDIKSSIKNCNFSNTPICSSYQSSPFANYIPDSCKSSCSGSTSGSSGSSGSGGKKTNSGGGTKVWPFILIGVAVLAIIGALGFLYMKKSKKGEKLDTYDSPKPILPVSKNNEKEEDKDENESSIEISVNENTPALSDKTPEIVKPVASAAAAAAITKNDSDDKKIEEVARNNYTNAYGGDAKQNAFPNIKNNRVSGASVKDIYRQHNVSGMSVEQDQSFYPHSSIYNTMTTDNDDSDNEVSDVHQPIINNMDSNEGKEKSQEQQPALLRRQSSRRANEKSASSSSQAEETSQDVELYVANWDYAPTLSDELALVAGDVIEVKKKFDDGWSTGYNRRTKQNGIVPLCYLKEYED